jgi:hypothetical protein
MKNDDLIRRLCEASEGSAELSAEVREALGGTWSANEPCLTTDLWAAWEEAERRRHGVEVSWWVDPPGYRCVLTYQKNMENNVGVARTPALALCAALLAAEEER